jgi:hypothetical protein
MQRAHIWSKFHLHRIKIIFIFFSFFLSVKVADGQQLHSQENFQWDANIPHYDDRFLHYGFTLGLNSTRFRPTLSNTYFNDSMVSVRSKPQGGFNLGFVMNMRLSKYFDVRLLPGVAFYTRAVQYQFKNGTSSDQTAESVFIETPLLLKYKSQRRKNHRLYMVGGLKTCFEAGAKKNQKTKDQLRTNSFDLCVEYGFGIDLYFQFFKFAPEIRFSHGINSLLNNDPNLYSQSLTRLTTHTVTLYFFFE